MTNKPSYSSDMFPQPVLTKYYHRHHLLRPIRWAILGALIITLIAIGATVQHTILCENLMDIAALLLIGLWVVSLFMTHTNDALWSSFVSGMTPDVKGVIASPLIGNEQETFLGRQGTPRHYQTFVEARPALFDKITVGEQLFGFNPNREYSDLGMTSYTFKYLVLAVELGMPVPHLFIDGRSQNRFGFKNRDMWSLQKKLSRANKLRDLEGDFYKSFDVYAASREQIEALTLVTPDVMLTLRDEGYNFDYELHGTKLYVIADADMKTPEAYTAYVQAAAAALLEFVPQITKHTFSATEPDLPLHPRRLTLWALWYMLVSLARILICIAIGCGIVELSQVIFTGVY